MVDILGDGVKQVGIPSGSSPDVTSLLADLGDASGSTLGSIYNILGNPGTNAFTAVIGQLADAPRAMNSASDGTDTLITLCRSILERVGQTVLDPDDSLHTEMTKVPRSDGTTSWNTTARAAIEKEALDALTVALPTNPATDIAPNSPLGHIMGAVDMTTYSKATDSLQAIRDRIDSIIAVTETGEATGTFSYLDAGGEQTIYEVTPLTTRREIKSIWLDAVNMTQDGTIKLYHKIDGSTYREFDSLAFNVATDSDGILIDGFTVNNDWKITWTEGADEGAARNMPYNVIWREME